MNKNNCWFFSFIFSKIIIKLLHVALNISLKKLSKVSHIVIILDRVRLAMFLSCKRRKLWDTQNENLEVSYCEKLMAFFTANLTDD